MKTCLVCDFGSSYVKYALVDEKGKMRENGRLPAPMITFFKGFPLSISF
jgi:sugar (pentulose or hexulose) kinase